MEGSHRSATSSGPLAGKSIAHKKDAPFSSLALQIVQAAVQPDASVHNLASLAGKDAAFSLRVLSLINSPVHGFARKVTDVQHASALLGVRGLQNIALGLTVTDMVPTGANGEALLTIGLRRAAAGRLLSERSGIGVPADHFTAGLVLEIGLLAVARKDLDLAGKLARVPAGSRPIRERAASLEPHPTSGATIAREWHLPPELAFAIEHHHDATLPQEPFARIAWVAEKVAASFEGGDVASLRQDALFAITQLGIPRSDGETILASLPGLVKEAAQAFERNIGAQPDINAVLTDANAALVDLNRTYRELITGFEDLVEEKDRLIKRLAEANARLEMLAMTDALTGLLNRRAFEDAATRDVSRATRSGAPLSLCILDVDYFKRVNDEHGHPAGDAVLRSIARSLVSCLRKGDLVGRLGGEEFSILLNATPIAGATLVADRLRAKIEATQVTHDAKILHVTASIGVVELASGEAYPAAMARVDSALYEAKQGGRNRVISR